MSRDINAGEVKKVSYLLVDPAEIVVDPATNGRSQPHTDADVERRCTSFEQHGQLQPVVCRKVAENKLQLVFGFCRHAAALRYNEKHPDAPMKLKVVVEKLTEEEAYLANLAENNERSALSIIDIAQAQQRLRDNKDKFKLKDKDIAKLFNMTPSYVCQIQRLLLLPKSIQKLVHLGSLAIGPALKMTYLDKDEQKAILEEIKAEKVLEEAEIARLEEEEEKEEKEVKKAKGEQTDAVPEKKEKKKKPKVETSKANEAIRKVQQDKRNAKEAKGEDTSGKAEVKTRPTFAAIRELFETMTGPGEEPSFRAMAVSFLKYFAGDITEEKFEKRLRAIFDRVAEPATAE